MKIAINKFNCILFAFWSIINCGGRLMKHKKLFIFLAVILLLFLLNSKYEFSKYITSEDTWENFEKMIEKNYGKAVLLYLLITIISSVALAVPGVTFAIIAGMLFGPWVGTILCSLGTTIGAGISFFVGRYFLTDSIRPLVEQNKYLKKWLLDEADTHGIFALMITRLIPIFPYNLQNFAYGITHISFTKYFIFSFLFMIPGTAMYTIGAAGISQPENRTKYILVAIGLGIIVFCSAYFLRKKYIKD